MNLKHVGIVIGLGCLAVSLYFVFSPKGNALVRRVEAQSFSTIDLRKPFQVVAIETHTIGTEAPRISLRTTTMRNGAGDLRVDLHQTIGLRLREIRVKRQDQIEWVANPDTKLRRTVRHLRADAVQMFASRPSPTKQCVASELGGEHPSSQPKLVEVEEIQRLQTYKLTFGENNIVWRAPALGCTEVQRRQAFTLPNGKVARSDMDLATYSFEEPPMAMFEPDAAWAEASPVTMLQAWVDRNKFERSEVERSMKQYLRMDTYYYSHRP